MIGNVLRDGSSKKKLKTLALSIPIFYLLLSIFPFAYQMLNQIPDNLIESKGTFSTKRISKNTYTVISNEQGMQILTCASSYKGHTKCLPNEISSKFTNRQVTAFWYKQKILPLTTNNRLVELYIDGNAVISGEMTKARMSRGKKDSIYIHLAMFALTLLISAFFLKKARDS